MIIGTKTKIYYANRSVAFTTEQEQLDQLWNSAIKDIEMAENDHRIEVEKIIPLNWIDSSEPPEWEENYKDRIVMPPREPVQLYEDSLEISFIKAVKKESATNSISDTTEKISYYALKFVPLLNIFLLLIISGISFGGYQYYQKAMHQSKDIARLENRLSQIQYDVPVEVNSKFDETFTFVNDLYYYDKAPSFKAVMKDVSEAMAEFMGLEIFKIDYSAKAAHLEIYGTITAPFDLAHKGYQQFLKIIKNKGYNIKESKFNTDIRESTFLLKLTRRIK